MPPFFKSFVKDDRGAATVDWVVLTAAVIIIPILVSTSVRDSIVALVGRITTFMSGL